MGIAEELRARRTFAHVVEQQRTRLVGNANVLKEWLFRGTPLGRAASDLRPDVTHEQMCQPNVEAVLLEQLVEIQQRVVVPSAGRLITDHCARLRDAAARE